MRHLIIAIILIFIIASTLLADTVIMKDRKEIKGLIVDEYVDRIVLSAVDGEKDILREDIERIEYDTPEQNFMQLGRSYDAKTWYDKAAFYYKKAMKINPDYKEAREAYLASHAKMWRQEERLTKKAVERQQIVMDWRENRYKEPTSGRKDKSLLLKDILGLSLEDKEGVFTIKGVIPYSSADKAGIQEEDLLVGIWGRLIRYSKIEDILDELLGPKYSEVMILIEKEIYFQIGENVVDPYEDLGVLLEFEYEGLIVKDVALGKMGESVGFKQGDFIVAIDGNFSRYLPLDSVIALIKSAKNNAGVVFTIRRKVTLRREG